VPVRLRAIAIVGISVTLLATTVATASAAATAHRITGGQTTVELDSTTLAAMGRQGLTLSAYDPAAISRGAVLHLRNRWGTVDPPNFVVHEAGGFTITKGARSVTINNLVLDTTTSRATANVTGYGNIRALILGPPNNGTGGPGLFQIGAFTVTFTPGAIAALDSSFGTAVFSRRPTLGIGTSRMLYDA
jgi:hypothetical protein